MNTEPTLESYAEAGFKALQERGPTDWVWRINVDTLNLLHPCRCVVGQLYGGFCSGLKTLKLIDGNLAERHGFAAFSYDYPALTSIWKRLILAERARQKAEVKEEAPALV